MKKLLGIVVLGLLWCNVAVAKLIEYKKCFPIMENGVETIEIWKSWDEWNKYIGGYHDYGLSTGENKLLYEGPRYDDIIFSIDTETGLITKLVIYNDQWLVADYNYQKQFHRDNPKEFASIYKHSHGKTFPSFIEKFKKNIFEPTNYAGDILEAIYIQQIDGRYAWKDTINLNLKSNEIHTRNEFFQENSWVTVGKLQCNMQTSDDNELNINSGTAFFINNSGNLLTNNHVIDECVQSKINYFNKEYDAQLIATDKNLDLALLKVDIIPRSFISFSKNKVKKRDEITAAGYPLGIEFSDDLKINDGKVSSLKGLDNNSNHITHNININPGNSGGPIVNKKGELVAVAVSGMSKEITEGLNFGIKSSAVENFLRSNNINPKISSTKFSMNNDKVNLLLEESTVYTFCEIK